MRNGPRKVPQIRRAAMLPDAQASGFSECEVRSAQVRQFEAEVL